MFLRIDIHLLLDLKGSDPFHLQPDTLIKYISVVPQTNPLI